MGSCKSRDITKERILEYSTMNLVLYRTLTMCPQNIFIILKVSITTCGNLVTITHTQTDTHAHVCVHTK